MLWRAAYAPRVLVDVPLPPLLAKSLDGESHDLATGVLTGAFEVSSKEVGIWLRLAPFSRAVFFGARQRELARQVSPPSRWSQTFIIEDDVAWRALIEPDPAERAFGAVCVSGVAKLLVIGAPTEEVWERFEAEIAQNLVG